MAADLHIHAMYGVTEADLACFFSNSLGSKYFNLNKPRCREGIKPGLLCVHWETVSDSPNVWIGEVSWLKAALMEDDHYIPEPVQLVQDLIGENLPVLDSGMERKILHAAEITNNRAANLYNVSGKSQELIDWLNKWQGYRLFTVSW